MLRVDVAIFGREDRISHIPVADDHHVLVVADGAGGTGDGALAADAVLAAVAAAPPVDAAACVALLTALDATLRRGETTAVIVALRGDALHGASVGDSGAWLVDAATIHELTEHQRRKPLLGSGRAVATAFTATLGAATLVLASDGLFNYAARDRVAALAQTADLPGLAARLVDLARLRSGALPDDAAVLVARRDR